MSTSPEVPRPHHELSDDERMLHKLGYAQELMRGWGGFSNFAISFTIISILAGCLTSYYIAIGWGGPVVVTWGWLLVGAFCIIVSLAMGEIASTYPTAGGLYYWSSRLGSPVWGWFTGWFNLVGQIAVTAAICYGAAIFVTALLGLWFDFPQTARWIFVVYSVILLVHGIVNTFGSRLLARVNNISAWWHMVGVLVVVGVLIFVPDHHKSVSFVFTETVNTSGFSGVDFSSPVFWFVAGIGLLMAQYTITGFDASAHMSEETRNASRTAAIGMVMSVVVSVVFGFILLVAVTFAIPGPAEDVALQYVFAVKYIWEQSMGTQWAEFLLVIACVAQLFCGLASVTSASRMMFAFSRDGAIPGHRMWRKVSSERVPVNAVWAICVLSWALMLPTLKNPTIGYAVGTSIAVIGLYIAFVLPIILRYRQKENFERGAWHLGNHYKWIDPLAIVWIAFICILFLMPLFPDGIPGNAAVSGSHFLVDVNWIDVNYAPLTVGAAVLLFGGWWVVSAHKWFKGPVRMGSEEELERIESGLGTQPGAAGD
ncbi:MAG: amino acid permease [Gaiellales bacterium]|jgi:amino acid transporter